MMLPLAAALWLSVLLLVGRLAQATRWGRALSEQPVVYALLLGVYATSWTYFGAVGLARTQGLSFLAVSLGPTLAALLVPVLWLPVLRLVRQHQLTTLADLLAFRYRSQAVGSLTTALCVLALVPYMALQVRAVATSAVVLDPSLPAWGWGAGFCLAMLLFASLFGQGHQDHPERHPGLVVAVALESVFKMAALLAVGALAVGLTGSEAASAALPPLTPASSFTTVCGLSMVSAFLLPRQFHLAFAEAPQGESGERALRLASWAFPLFLFCLNLPIPFILAAGLQLNPQGNADLYVLDVARLSPWLAPLAWLGGLSASAAMVMVGGLALTSMVVTHAVRPAVALSVRDVYGQVARERRVVLASLIALAFVCFLALELAAPSGSGGGGVLAGVGLVSFAGLVQVLPAFLGVLFLSGLTRRGVQWGLVTGMGTWLVFMLLPALGVDALTLPAWLTGGDLLTFGTLLSLGANVLVTGMVSLRTEQDPEEARAASLCRRVGGVELSLLPGTAAGFLERLAPIVGVDAGQHELEATLAALQLQATESQPEALERVRELLEQRLTALVGPLLSHLALAATPAEQAARSVPLAERIRLLEAQAREGRGGRRAADELRAWLDEVLRALPVGLAVVGAEGDVVWWNARLAAMSGVPEADARGRRLTALPSSLGEALAFDGEHRVVLATRVATWRVGSRTLEDAALGHARVLAVEDLTDTRRLEAQVLHQDRLATIGRFAAGVAHEVGNPLAALLMVADNLAREEHPEDVPQRLGLIADSGHRIDDIVRRLVGFARTGQVLEHAPMVLLSAGDLARDAARLAGLARSREVDLQPGPELQVEGHGTELVQVLVNLLANAFDATPEGRAVRLQVRAVGPLVRFEVVDEGAGMSPEVAAHVFEPFFTTKPTGQGTGLGLSVSWSIARAHGGTLEVQSTPGQGTTMSLVLPRPTAP
jgi:signal transduction histidine kinase